MAATDTQALRTQFAAILRALATNLQASAQQAMHYASTIESSSATAHDIAQMSMQFPGLPMMMPAFGGIATGDSTGTTKKKRGKGGADAAADVIMEDAGEGKKRKRGANKEKKAKDPNAPKRPPSAYLLYQNEVRKEIREQHPEMKYPEVLQEISKMWNALSNEEKKPYLDATDLAKAEYDKVKEEYDREHPQAAAGAGGAAGAAGAASAATPAAATDVLSDVDEENEVEEEIVAAPPVLTKSKAGKKKGAAAAAPTTKATPVSEKKGKAAPPPVVESSSDVSDDEDEEDEVDSDEEEEQQQPPKKKSKKEATPPPPPPPVSKGKKDKKRK